MGTATACGPMATLVGTVIESVEVWSLNVFLNPLDGMGFQIFNFTALKLHLAQGTISNRVWGEWRGAEHWNTCLVVLYLKCPRPLAQKDPLTEEASQELVTPIRQSLFKSGPTANCEAKLGFAKEVPS